MRMPVFLKKNATWIIGLIAIRFDEDGEFKFGKVTNLGNEASVNLRDASGRPGWSGRGWRS